MAEKMCGECGELLEEEMVRCPSCGTPVSDESADEADPVDMGIEDDDAV